MWNREDGRRRTGRSDAGRTRPFADRRHGVRRHQRSSVVRTADEEDDMGRGTGTGLTALGIVLLIVGAILKFAVQVDTKGFDIQQAGLILLVAGAVALLLISLLPIYAYHSKVMKLSQQKLADTERLQQTEVTRSIVEEIQMYQI